VIGDLLRDLWEPAVVLLLAAILVYAFLLPDKVVNRLTEGDVAKDLKEIGHSAAKASRRVQALNNELAAGEELGRWRSIMQTALGAVIGLAGGFLGPWVSEADFTTGVLRGVIVIGIGIVVVLLMSVVVFPLIDARIEARAKRKTKEAGNALEGGS
jgi:predicted acyltransferase